MWENREVVSAAKKRRAGKTGRSSAPAKKKSRRAAPGKKSAAPPVPITLRNTKKISPEAVQKLFRAAGWNSDLARYPAEKIRRKLNQSFVILSAWQDKELVGFASGISDGVLCAFVDNLVVHPGVRGRGVGSALMDSLGKELRRQGVEYIFGLGARTASSNRFLKRAGFGPIPWRVYLRGSR